MDKSEKVFEYQMQIINRRWQYFATYLLLLGISANAIPKEVWEPVITTPNHIAKKPFILLSTSEIILGIIFSQLISKATERIENIERFIGKKDSITNLDLNSRFIGFLSETVLLYFTLYFFSSLWLYVLYNCSLLLFFISIALLIANLFFLKWKSIAHVAEENQAGK